MSQGRRGAGPLVVVGEMARLGWSQTLRSKLLVGAGLIVLFAAGLAFVIARSDGPPPAGEIFQTLQLLVLSTVVVPLVALLVGTNAMGSERESGTLGYVFTRPLQRTLVVIGKGLAALGVSVAIVGVAALAVFAASGFPSGAQLVGGLLALSLEAVALTAVFVLLGTVLARSLYLGLAYVVLVEGVLGNVAMGSGGVTLTYHARNLLGAWSAIHLDSDIRTLVDLPTASDQSVAALLAVTVVALALAAAWVETREYGLRDRPKEE